MPILSEDAAQKIKTRCAQAYQAYDKGEFKMALRLFYQAWVELPKPQSDYTQAGWVLTAIGDTYFKLQQYRQSCEALKSALHCPGAQDSPFIHLRLGQNLFEMEEVAAARNHLHKAYRSGGVTLFSSEPSHYLDCIADLL